ncbi:MAG: thioredoxin family protein [Candidatus Eisenbacteria bacterium]|nr:thioredoxin family protein [Candidatus Eisenbacteria bacterium]
MRILPIAVLVAALGLVPPALAAGKAAAGRTPQAGSVLPWIANNYADAVSLARARHVPLFVEAWAPWCHTCRSMRAFVLNDASLARHAKRFVWLDVDTEDPRNSAFRKRYPIEAIPSFYVIDPDDQVAKVRWIGGLTLTQLNALLDDASSGAYSSRAMLDRVAVADSLFGSGDNAAAAKAYQQLLESAKPDWKGYPRAVESLMFSLLQTRQNLEAVAVARSALPRLGRTPSALSVSASGLNASYNLPDSLPERAAAISEFEASTRSLVTDTTFHAAADDRSGAWIELLSAREALQDSAGAHAVAGEWSAFLDRSAAAAVSPDQRMVFDSHRLSAYLELGQPERAVPMLEQSERDRPDDYNPPARLAMAYLAMKHYDDALAASNRAMLKAYGPRKLLLYSTRAEIYEGKGDIPSARRTIEGAIAYLETLPEEQRTEGRMANLKRQLAALPAAP